MTFSFLKSQALTRLYDRRETALANIIADQAGYKLKYVYANTAAESVVSVVGGYIDSAVSFPPAFGPLTSRSGIFAPKGVPEDVVTKLIDVTKKIMQDAKVLQHTKTWVPGSISATATSGLRT